MTAVDLDLTFVYPWLKFAHILLAIVAVGFNFSYAILIRRASREPQHMGHVLRSVKLLDDRFATPAYVLLPVPGLAMVFIGGWDIADLWILASLVLYGVLVVIGLFMYSPALRGQIAALDASGPDSVEFRSLTTRGNAVGGVIALIVVVIIGLMVLKPTL